MSLFVLFMNFPSSSILIERHSAATSPATSHSVCAGSCCGGSGLWRTRAMEGIMSQEAEEMKEILIFQPFIVAVEPVTPAWMMA